MAHSHDHPKAMTTIAADTTSMTMGGLGNVHAPASYGKAFALGMGLDAALVVMEAACYPALTGAVETT